MGFQKTEKTNNYYNTFKFHFCLNQIIITLLFDSFLINHVKSFVLNKIYIWRNSPSMDKKQILVDEDDDSQQNYPHTHKKNPVYEEQDLQPLYDRHCIQADLDAEKDLIIAKFKQKYEKKMERSDYTAAEKIKGKINYYTSQNKKERVRAVSAGHSRQKMLIKKAHREQMNAFNMSWIGVFERNKAVEQRKLERMQYLKERDTHIYREQIMRRSQSAKPTKKISQLQYYEKTEKLLRKRGKTQQLKEIRSQKARLRKQCNQEHGKIIDKIVRQEEKKFEEKQTKRYHSFMHRINQTRQDNQKKYRREERRLKQKYKNILKNLEHEQKMQLRSLAVKL